MRMKHSFKKNFLTSLSCLLLLFTSLTFLSNEVLATEDYHVAAKAAYAIDADSSKVFFDQNGQEVLPIASMTKLVTAYLILEAVKNGEFTWADSVTISPHVETISQDMALSNVPLSTEGEYTVKDLFDAMLIASANGCAMALAEKAAGSENAFVDKMREKVQSWGIQDAQLINASGLNNDCLQGQIYPGTAENDENMMSAKGMATVAWHLLKDFPEVLEVTKMPTKVFKEDTQSALKMNNWNWMLPDFDLYKEGVDGLKTGTTDLAGACFTGTINLNNWRLITVVMNTDGGEENSGLRFTETGNLMDHVYASWKQETVLKKDSPLAVQKQLPVAKGKQESVSLKLGEDVTTWVRNDMDLTNLKVDFKVEPDVLNDEKALVAPIDRGTEVGTISVKLKDDNLGYLSTPQSKNYPIVTGASVEKANVFVLIGRSIKNFFTQLF